MNKAEEIIRRLDVGEDYLKGTKVPKGDPEGQEKIEKVGESIADAKRHFKKFVEKKPE